MVTYEEFAKLDLRVARVVEAARVENSSKLLRLVVDLGTEKRQIIAGIGKAYGPEDLVGKNIVVVANMNPKVIAGLESQGMLLAAGEKEIVLLTAERDVAPGSKIG